MVARTNRIIPTMFIQLEALIKPLESFLLNKSTKIKTSIAKTTDIIKENHDGIIAVKSPLPRVRKNVHKNNNDATKTKSIFITFNFLFILDKQENTI